MAPKKRAKHCKNKARTEKQIKLFPSVIALAENRDKPFAYVLETLALKNVYCFERTCSNPFLLAADQVTKHFSFQHSANKIQPLSRPNVNMCL